RALGRPARRPPGRLAGEAGTRQALELPGQRRHVLLLQPRGEADVVEQAAGVVEAEEQRPDEPAAGAVAEAADDAVRGALALDLQHRALARLVWLVEALGDDAVERTAGAAQPLAGPGEVARRRQHDVGGRVRRDERFQAPASLGERQA